MDMQGQEKDVIILATSGAQKEASPEQSNMYKGLQGCSSTIHYCAKVSDVPSHVKALARLSPVLPDHRGLPHCCDCGEHTSPALLVTDLHANDLSLPIMLRHDCGMSGICLHCHGTPSLLPVVAEATPAACKQSCIWHS